MSEKIAVEMINIEKIYPDGQYALRGVDLVVKEGEIHGILGENGAGKTTLMRILYGEIKPTRGVIKIYGRRVRFHGPWDAIRAGIGMIYQNFSLVPTFTVGENLYLSLLSLKKRISYREAIELADKYVKMLGFKLPYNEYIENLSVGIQQRVEIIKVLMRGARIIILDEPTSVLNPLEVRELFRVLRRLREEGYSMIYITHKLREIREIADRITVLRRGRVVKVFDNPSNVSEIELAKAMVQADISSFERSKSSSTGRNEDRREIVLEIEDLWVRDQNLVDRVKGVSIRVYRGEILGVAGVQGNGQIELAEAIAGVREIHRGRILFKNIDITRMSADKRYKLGISFVPESREIGLVYGLNIPENILLTRVGEFSDRLGFIKWKSVMREASYIVRSFNVLTRSLSLDVRYLSGGNQQKILLGRELSRDPDLLIISEPTRGLDIASTRYIRDLLKSFRDRNKSVLLFSTDLDEIFELSDRIAVMSEGRIVAIGKPNEFTLERIGVLMGGGSL
ncbi:MAG: ABC transporter ATP-binding protein [Sulfolobales archaeon]